MTTICFFLFLRLNGSVNSLKPRIYYITYYSQRDFFLPKAALPPGYCGSLIASISFFIKFRVTS